MSDQALPYHHGNLPRALLDSAAEVIAEVGPAQMSLREVARRSGVSNAAPVHHFGDKAGLFTALAAEGYQLLAAELAEASETTGDFVAVGVAYVRFAVKHRAHFEVMFRPELYDRTDPRVVDGVGAAGRYLYGPAAAVTGTDGPEAGIAAWAVMHGLATLILNENLDEFLADPGADVAAGAEDLARRIGRFQAGRSG